MLKHDNSRGDIWGGFTSAAVALPLALAFGEASGLGALAGIYGAIAVGFFAAAFGGTSVQISGPTGPMTVVVATIVVYFSGNLALTATVIILAGLIQILFGIAGVGRYIKLVPQPVVSGFLTGIGLIVVILQIGPMLGYASPQGSNFLKLSATPSMLLQPNLHAFIVGTISFCLATYTPRKINQYIPSTLIAVICGTLIGYFFLGKAPSIGEFPSGLPKLYLPSVNLHDLPDIIRFAMILAFLGSIDSLLTSLAADSRTKTHHDSNRELVGQGIGNVAAGLIGGTPGAGATMRTFVNISSGGTTRLSGMIHAIVLLTMAVLFAKQVGHIPLAVLGGILLKVGIDIIDWRTLKRARRLPRAGVVIMLTTLLLTVFVDLLTAVATGTIMASLIFVSKMANAQMDNIKSSFDGDIEFDLTTEEAAILKSVDDRIILLKIEGPLSFATARDIARMMEATPRNDVLVVDLSDVPFIDSSAAATLEETSDTLIANDDHIIILGASKKVRSVLEKTDLFEIIGKNM
ncbi:MAG: SulP family sulfate permease, partial [Pseudohongiellaceae bacterium]